MEKNKEPAINHFEKIAGYTSEKKSLRELALLFRSHRELAGMGVRLPRGLLISGEPGVGKTVMAEALIAAAGVPCIRVSVADVACDEVLASYLESKFDEAACAAPAIVFMDELDKLVGGADRYASGCFDMDNTRQLLQVMNDHRDAGITVVATVNDLDMVCSALKRSGRFDRILKVGLPTPDDRREIIRYYMAGKATDDSVDVDLFTKMSAGMSGADIECLFNEAGIHALLEKREAIGQRDIDFAIEQKLFHGTPRETAMSDLKKQLVATHEAGHLVAGLLTDPDNVVSVAILPQGESEGHVSMAQDHDVMSFEQIENRIIVALAGKASETVFFPNRFYLGSADDIRYALSTAEHLVGEEGLCGLAYCVFPSRCSPFGGVSDSRRQWRIGEKVDELAQTCFRKALTLIEQNRELVAFFARQLTEHYALTREEIMRLYREQTAVLETTKKTPEKGVTINTVGPQTPPERKEIA